MNIYGYHRTSTTEQHLDRGLAEIKEYCQNNGLTLKKIYTDQQTGKNFNRPEWLKLKHDALRAGDTLIITELDRLGRNKADTLKEIRQLNDNGIRLMVLELPTTLIDLSSIDNSMQAMFLETINNMMIELYASIAQAETEKRSKRQTEGIAAKQARGEWGDYGRPKAIDLDTFSKAYKQVAGGKQKPFDCMHQLGLTKPTFYRYKKQYEALALDQPLPLPKGKKTK